MALCGLAVELLTMIIQAIDDPVDLHSLIAASAECFRVFNCSPERFLASVIGNAILPAALPHALAVINVPSMPTGSVDSQKAAIRSFLEVYFSGQSPSFPVDMRSLVALSRLTTQITRLMDDYSARALQVEFSEVPIPPRMRLSLTERARLQRAFFRFELYFRVFPMNQYSINERNGPHSLFSYHSQFILFLKQISLWEVEELNCVHHYLLSLITELFNDLEDQVVKAIATAPGVKRPAWADPSCIPARGPCTRSALSPQNELFIGNLSITQNNTDSVKRRLVDFDYWNIGLFPRCQSRRWEDYIILLSSRGLKFINKLLSANNEQRQNIIMAPGPIYRPFLCQASDFPASQARQMTNPSFDIDDPTKCNLSWVAFKRLPTSNPFSGEQPKQHLALRERGFVFWDAQRIRADPRRWMTLSGEQLMNIARFNRRGFLTVEERLMGFTISETELNRIEMQFSSKMTNLEAIAWSLQ